MHNTLNTQVTASSVAKMDFGNPDVKVPDTSKYNLKRQGSIRKVLPSVLDVDTQLSMAAKLIDRRTSSPRGSHSYGPFFQEYSLLAEYSLLEKQKLPGIYVIPAAKTPLQWFGVMFVRHGLYQGGIFRFTVHIPETYPDGDCPEFIFDTPVFHPQIHSELGMLDVKKGFQKWRRNVNHLWHLMLYARRIFYKIDSSDPYNLDASNLYENDVDAYRIKVEECVQASIEKLYDPPNTDDPHAIRFSMWDPHIHGELHQKLIDSKQLDNETSKLTGLSWVQKGSLQIFSKEKATL